MTLAQFKRRLSKDTNELINSDEALAKYREQLARDRNARTVTVRSSRPSIAAFRNRNNPTSKIPPKPQPFLEPSYALSQFATNDPSVITQFFTSVVTVAHQSPQSAAPLITNSSFLEALILAITDSPNEEFTIVVLKYFVDLFPLYPDIHIQCVDNGLCLGLSEPLSSDSIPLLEAVISCIDCIAESSSYARDSVLCFGVHESLIDCALRCISEQLTVSAVEALNKVFANSVQIDPSSLSSCVEPMAKLLRLPFPSAVTVALTCFVAMTNTMPALVFTMFGLELFPVIVNMLSDDRLVSAALPLIGNIALCQSEHMDALIKCGLFDILKKLLKIENYTADVFWVLSNLVESVPDRTMRFFDDEFIKWAVAEAGNAAEEIKKEAVFFLATLVVSREADDLGVFVDANVLLLMVQMLRSSVWLIILRCLNALVKLERVIRNSEVVVSEGAVAVFHGMELRDALIPLMDLPHALIGEWAEGLLTQIEGGEGVDAPEFDSTF
jgi:hypothetical protein